jgi:hypothetical protein
MGTSLGTIGWELHWKHDGRTTIGTICKAFFFGAKVGDGVAT